MSSVLLENDLELFKVDRFLKNILHSQTFLNVLPEGRRAVGSQKHIDRLFQHFTDFGGLLVKRPCLLDNLTAVHFGHLMVK